MFERSKQRRFEKETLDIIADLLLKILGEERAAVCAIMFRSITQEGIEAVDFPSDFLVCLRKEGATSYEAAWSYLDAAVTGLRRLCRMTVKMEKGLPSEIQVAISDIEFFVDKMFGDSPSVRFVPNNGRWAEAMKDFSEPQP